MSKYHKINTIFKRDMDVPGKTKPLLVGQWSCPEFEFLQNNMWDFSEKVDGTNIRVLFDGTAINFEGREANSQIPAVLVNNLCRMFLPKLEIFKMEFPYNVVEGEAPHTAWWSCPSPWGRSPE